MKLALKTLALALLVSSCMMLSATTVTVGSYDSGNCYPFMCNDSGTSSGVSIDYQQAYELGRLQRPDYHHQHQLGLCVAVSAVTRNSGRLLHFLLGLFGRRPGALEQSRHQLQWLSDLLGTASASAGGFNYGPVLTPFHAFTYNPGQGDLILEIVVNTQDNVPNGSGNGYNWADYTGADTTRAYCLTNDGLLRLPSRARWLPPLTARLQFPSPARWSCSAPELSDSRACCAARSTCKPHPLQLQKPEPHAPAFFCPKYCASLAVTCDPSGIHLPGGPQDS